MKELRKNIDNIHTLKIHLNEIQVSNTKKFIDVLNDCIVFLQKQDTLENLLMIINPLLVCKKSKIPSKLVLFIKRLFEGFENCLEGRNILISLAKHLILLLNLGNTKVRKNSIFILKIISSLNIFQDEFLSQFIEKMSEKLFDKEKSVRKEAILVLINYQNVGLDNNITVVKLLKNLCRYDSSIECRKLILENLDVNSNTFDCILDRCADVNIDIRHTFYKNLISKINLKELKHDKRIFLIKQVFSEREFECIDFFINACILYYDLPTEFDALIADFYNSELENIMCIFIKRLLCLFSHKLHAKQVLNNLSFEFIFFYAVYLEHIEETQGRDELELLSLPQYLESVYNFVKTSEENKDKLRICNLLFKVIYFYDVFDEESKKMLFSIVYKLIKNHAPEEILNAVIKLAYKIDTPTSDKMFGTLIYKHIENCPLYAFQISKYLLKYSVKIYKIQEAILNEIILNYAHSNHVISLVIAENLFYYLNIEFDELLFDKLIFFGSSHNKFFEMVVDLVIKFKNPGCLKLAQNMFTKKVSEKDASVFKAGVKLILSNQLTDSSEITKFIVFAIIYYFNEDDEQIQQYLNVFLFEYFLDDSRLMIDAFCDAFENIEKSEKYFVDRCLYIVENSKTLFGLQTLFYKICVNIYLFYSDPKLINRFIYVLKKINISETWDRSLTKKIILCLKHLMVKPLMTAKLNDLNNKLLAIDDAEPINEEDEKAVKHDLCIQ